MSVIEAPLNRRVLIAHGDASIRQGIEALLRRERLGTPITVEKGEDVVDLMTVYASEIYVIVLDLGMPDMSGFDVLRKVAKRLEEPVSVIGVTAMRTQIIRSRFDALMRRSELFCATDLAVAPVKTERLLYAVANGLEKVHFRRKYWLDRMLKPK